MKFSIETLSDKFFCSELNIKHYKELLKCSFGDEPDKDIFCETVSDIFSSLLNKPSEQIKQMSVVDILLIVLQLRINSQGDSIKLSVTKDEKQMGLELDLNYIKNSIIEFYKPFSEIQLADSNIQIRFNSPSLARLCEEGVKDEYIYFLNEVCIKNKSFEFKTNTEATSVFDNLPPKLALQFIDCFEDFFIKSAKNNFLKKYNVDQTLTFTPSLESLIWFTKLLFNEPLDVFYDNLFYLSHLGHLDLGYVETLSPGEYTYMVRKLEQSLKARSPDTSSDQDIQDASDEGFDDSGMFEEQN